MNMWREELYGKFLHLLFDSAVNFRWLLRNKALIKTQTCTGTTQRDGMGREEGGRFRMGNTCIPVADSC